MGYKKESKSLSPGAEMPDYVYNNYRPEGHLGKTYVQGSGEGPMPQAEDIT